MKGDCVRGKQAKTLKLCEHIVIITSYPSVHREVELHSLLALVILIFY